MPIPPPTRDLAALRRIMADLRAPDTGCPWDIEQSFATIAPFTIEEAYEVADAIERNDMDDLKGELGDLLLQVVYHSQMASEAGAFDLKDVVGEICEKMIRRHPHVYGDRKTPEKGFWERQKAEERAQRQTQRGQSQRGQSQRGKKADKSDVLADVPRALPALSRAAKLQGRAARVGFDWPDTEPVFAKITEEIAELRAAMTADEPPARLSEELGDILFVLANLGRHLGLDPEAALSSANAKFIRRFAYIEKRLAQDKRTPEASDLEEMDRLWDEAKAAEGTPSKT